MLPRVWSGACECQHLNLMTPPPPGPPPLCPPAILSFRLVRNVCPLHPLSCPKNESDDNRLCFERHMVSTLQALRGGWEVLLATMDVFLNEPVIEWVSEGGADERQRKKKKRSNGEKLSTWYIDIVFSASIKLCGCCCLSRSFYFVILGHAKYDGGCQV